MNLAIGEPGPGLRALAADHLLVSPDRADVILWPAHRRRTIPVGAMLNVIDLRGIDPADTIDLRGADLLLVGSATAYGAWAIRAGTIPLAVIPPRRRPGRHRVHSPNHASHSRRPRRPSRNRRH